MLKRASSSVRESIAAKWGLVKAGRLPFLPVKSSAPDKSDGRTFGIGGNSLLRLVH